ncbi:Chitin synthase D [Golovinomyces cichoracearum]|uniref:chitin synthase n=1 Tax=Golovinomyces cichoracearum TaxID=62708 RepID=A0A420IFM1_9PEZI|nr:Chitin synthase D [Golovinomyces cichoracearum]
MLDQYDTSPWPIKDIIYTAIIGTIMAAAFLEWFLWLAAFIYCLFKVYQKAEHWSVQILALIVGILFTLLRLIFLPIMVTTLPLPTHITQYFPVHLVSFLQWFGFWSFAILLTIPWLFCVYQLVTHHLGRTKRIKEVLDEHSAPKVVIVMPCYKEEPDVLVTAINSVVDCDYPPSCIHVFLSFDGDQEDELYLNTIEKLGVPLSLESYPKSIDVTYRSARITVSRFPHGGKRQCQKATFKLIDRVYTEYLKRNDNLFILFIDSDCILDRVCLQNFVYDMELSPGNSRDMLAMTGVITSTTKKHSLITLLQDMEYVHGQLFERTVESGCGAVTCLPGALTMLRFSAFRRMAKYYFADKAEQCEDLFDYGKCHLGEDRWLTHLFMIGAKRRYQIQMCTSAFCKTEAVQTYRTLVKQRRRWFLGFITNEVCMLTDIRIWKRYPILVLVRFMQNTIRTTALLFFIMLVAIASTSMKVKDLPVGFIGISLGLNWLMMIYFGFKLKRYKVWLYPMMFLINPFFNYWYMVYGIFTSGQRTWGGPRADAGQADANTTPQQAIAKAEATGDDLNVVPETFKQTTDGQRPATRPGVHLQPPDRIQGCFAAPEMLPGGWYEQGNDSVISSSPIGMTGVKRPPMYHRDSFDSNFSAGTTTSVYLPRRVESIMGEEDRKKYAIAQANQIRTNPNPIGSNYPHGQVYEISENDIHNGAYKDSLESLQSEPYSFHRSQSANSTRSLEPYGDAGEDPLSPASPSSLILPPSAASSFNKRGGRSPLARQSLVRTVQDENEIELELQPDIRTDRSPASPYFPSKSTTSKR